MIQANPAAAVRRPKASRPKLSVPDSDGLRRVMEAARGTLWEIPVLMSATTALRRSEVLGLRWSDVDLEVGKVRAVQGLQRVRDPDGHSELAFLDLKSERARREIVLLPLVVRALREQRRRQAERRLASGDAWIDVDLVCDRGDGGAPDPDAFTHAFKRIAKAANVSPATRLHDLRHGVATALLAQGVHPAIVSALLGHSSPGFTMGTYQHMLDGMTVEAAKALERALGL